MLAIKLIFEKIGKYCLQKNVFKYNRFFLNKRKMEWRSKYLSQE